MINSIPQENLNSKNKSAANKISTLKKSVFYAVATILAVSINLKELKSIPIYDDYSQSEKEYVDTMSNITRNKFFQQEFNNKTQDIHIAPGDFLYNVMMKIIGKGFDNAMLYNYNNQEILFSKKVIGKNDELLQIQLLHEYIHYLDSQGYINHTDFFEQYQLLEKQNHPVISDINTVLMQYKNMGHIDNEKISYLITFTLLRQYKLPQDMINVFGHILKEGVL